jgi:hypothetical protein
MNGILFGQPEMKSSMAMIKSADNEYSVQTWKLQYVRFMKTETSYSQLIKITYLTTYRPTSKNPLTLSKTGSILIRACLPIAYPKQRGAPWTVYVPSGAISHQFKKKNYSAPHTLQVCQARGSTVLSNACEQSGNVK